MGRNGKGCEGIGRDGWIGWEGLEGRAMGRMG